MTATSNKPASALTPEIFRRADELVARMTLHEKVGQMAQIDSDKISPEEVAANHIGSVLSGGGSRRPGENSAADWAQFVRDYEDAALKTRLGIPLLYGVDAVHGHNNVQDTVIFPHNIGLGATRDADLVRRIGEVTAAEMLATNIHWTFAPTVAVAQDFRWGRTYESYSEDPAIVSELGAALIRGLQDPDLRPEVDAPLGALATAKHFVADGGTRWQSTRVLDWLNWWPFGNPEQTWAIDQGDADIDEETLRRVHLPPYQAAIEAGALSIMVSYSSWQGAKMHAHKYLLTDVLKGELGFQGFLISDYLAINQLDPDYARCVELSINAGLDMIMVPFDYHLFIDTLVDAVERGAVSMARIDDAVRRILAVKIALGLFEQPYGEERLLARVGSAEHRAVAREAVQKSLVLLKNEGDVLPLSKDGQRLLVAGSGADDVGMQCGGWTIEWMGKRGPITAGTSLLQGIRQTVSAGTEVLFSPDGAFELDEMAEVGIVVVGEEPYVEGNGDRPDLTLSAEDQALVRRMRGQCQRLVVIVLSGRPVIITDIVEDCDALVAAWLPGTEGQGVADVLFGDYPFTGKLSFSWPRSMAQIPLSALHASPEGPLFPLGHGLETA
ncbi:MAG: glycoside hydrolase family 3 N-terminal domain-containing protein [Anaerolineae bacterium]